MHLVRRRCLFIFIDLIALLVGAGACSPASTDGVPGDGVSGDGSSGDAAFPVVVESTVGQDVVLTTVTGSSGAVEIEIEVDLAGVRIRLPLKDAESVLEFPDRLPAFPSEEAANAFGAFVAGQIVEATSSKQLRIRDNPGCDLVPNDPRCMVRCCAAHDACYYENDCTAVSWIPTFVVPGSFVLSDCVGCNLRAALCILGQCPFSEGDPDDIDCFDASCGEGYACPSLDCDVCASPCSCAAMGLELDEASGECRDPSACSEADGSPCPDEGDTEVPDSVGVPGNGLVTSRGGYMNLLLQSGPSPSDDIDLLGGVAQSGGENIDEPLEFDIQRGCTGFQPELVAIHQFTLNSFVTSPVDGRMIFDYTTKNPDQLTACDWDLDYFRATAGFEATVEAGQTLRLRLRATQEESISPNIDFALMHMGGMEVVTLTNECVFDCLELPGEWEMEWTFDELMNLLLTEPNFSPQYTRDEGFRIYVLVEVTSRAGRKLLNPVTESRNTIDWSIEVR